MSVVLRPMRQMAGSSLVFNIIYTPGTVRYLAFFVSSLLQWSTASFRLVSNGCDPGEQHYLRTLCKGTPRLEYWAIPTKGMLPHGLALNYLQTMTRTPLFCFMDSDMFACGDFLGGLVPHLNEFGAVFSGAPLWLLGDDGILPHTFVGVWGEYFCSAGGRCLGSTYLALYDNDIVTELMQDTGIGFEGRDWDEVPSGIQQRLATLGFPNSHFDTGKVLALLFQDRERAVYLDAPTLCHIGGTSFQALYHNSTASTTARLRSTVRKSVTRLGYGELLDKWSLAREVNAQKGMLPSEEARVVVHRRARQRNPTRIYLLKVLQALVDRRSAPPRPETGLPELNWRLDTAANALRGLYAKFAESGRLDGG
jgi:hypothetical protein